LRNSNTFESPLESPAAPDDPDSGYQEDPPAFRGSRVVDGGRHVVETTEWNLDIGLVFLSQKTLSLDRSGLSGCPVQIEQGFLGALIGWKGN
jgi:hypothetical protein